MKAVESSWRLKFWRVPHLRHVELMHASNLTHDYPRHVHEEFCLVIVLRGAETHVCRGKSYEASAGDLMLLNADEAHASRSVGAEYRVIHIRPRALARLASEIFGGEPRAPYFAEPVVRDPPLFRLLLGLHLKLGRDDAPLGHESELVSALGFLLARRIKTRSALRPPGKEARRVKLIQDYLKSHYAENVPLARLAALADLSPFHLLRVFREQVGVPPHEYQIQVRVAHAKRLLHAGHPISQAAVETGFFDQSHLSRNFKRIVGVTPGRYSSLSKIMQDPAGPA